MWLLVAGALSGCTGLVKHRALSFLNTYEAALQDYMKGDIMRARARVLNMDKSRPDYKKAYELLVKKIEPARLRLLNHYVRSAEVAEKKRLWYVAKEHYQRALEFAVDDTRLRKKIEDIDRKMRRLRMDRLHALRQKEVLALRQWVSEFKAPKELGPQDEVFVHERERHEQWLDAMANQSLSEAKRYLRMGYPEAAWVEILVHLSLKPESRAGRLWADKIREAMPAELKRSTMGTKLASKPTQRISAEDVIRLLKAKQWREAGRLARLYKEQEGKDADKLYEQVRQQLEKAAHKAFQKGTVAFRKERLDEAVRYWEEAVALDPNNREYVASLRRARQLQEQLRILKEEQR